MGNETGENKNSPDVSRRRLLKLLAASGAVVGLGRLMPTQWIAPAAALEPKPDTVIPEDCDFDNFPLTLNTTAVHLVNSTIGTWKVEFDYDDMGGFLNSSAMLTAGVQENGFFTPIHLFVPVSGANGSVIEEHSIPGYWEPCMNDGTVIFPGHTNGTGYFHLNYSGPELNKSELTAVNDLTPILNWSVAMSVIPGGPIQSVPLAETTAVSLQDFIVDSDNSGAKAAAVVGAAALGAATVKVFSGDKEEAEGEA